MERLYYFIDGYNFIFHLKEGKESLKTLREKTLHFLRKKFCSLKLSGMIVFDGSHRIDEESGRGYQEPLEIAFAPKGQTADEYIIEKISLLKNRALVTVVSNDKALNRKVKDLNAKTVPVSSFLKKLQKRKAEVEKPERKETKKNLERLQKIFEERL